MNDLQKMINKMKRNQSSKSIGMFALGAACAAAVGIAVGAVCMTKWGKETKQKLMEKARGLFSKDNEFELEGESEFLEENEELPKDAEMVANKIEEDFHDLIEDIQESAETMNKDQTTPSNLL